MMDKRGLNTVPDGRLASSKGVNVLTYVLLVGNLEGLIGTDTLVSSSQPT